jgi:hypothetical protein
MKKVLNFAFIRVFSGSLLLLSACANHKSPLTIAPHSVTTTQASFDNNTQNSGVISANENGFLVTPHFIERHALNPADRGVTAEGANFRITAEVMARCIDMDQKRKNAQKL